MNMIEHWHVWLVVGFIILIVEMMSGTYFLLAIAGGAALTSAITWWFTPSLTAQLFIFAVSSAISYMILLSFRKEKTTTNTDGTTHMLGQRVQVVDAINQQGRVRYKGVLWQASSTDAILANAFAEIIAVEGSTLIVKKITSGHQENS